MSNSFFVSLLNSEFIFTYYREFINCTVNIQINDLRQVIVKIPEQKQLNEIEQLFKIVYNLKKQAFYDKDINNDDAINKVEEKLNLLINSLYSI